MGDEEYLGSVLGRGQKSH